MNKQPKGHGFIPEPIVEEDYVFGASNSLQGKFTGDVLNPDGDWTPYLPDLERQSYPGIETNGCVSFGTLNALEMLSKRVFGIAVNFSDRMVVKGSGTNPKAGNTPKKVADYIRKNWSVFESEYPFKNKMSLTEFYQDIPNNLLTLALARGAEYEFGYQYITPTRELLIDALKYSPIGVSVPAWSQEDGIYYRPEGWKDNHWCVLINIKKNGNYVVLDTYDPYIKEISKDVVFGTAMGYHVNNQIKDKTLFDHFLDLIYSILGITKVEMPPIVPIPPIKPAREYILDVAETYIGKEASVKNLAPEELGCAESVSHILHKCFADFPDDITYTATLYSLLQQHPNFKRVLDFKPGNVIISPTGYGNGKVVGHVGIMGRDGIIMSNNSNTGLWDTKFDLPKWIARYRNKGGLPIYVFERV